ncbi:phospholipase D family protein [Clostridium lundense]|uniref:phospholipase D family protein n=1 Tax=Clostridium lundense TaxID=319475 RepID=UPI000484BC6D|nr:phospholipase D family protein [Clostridium lundense]
MIRPAEDRLNYSSLLNPPLGYEVEFAIGTTYSLDLEALVGVPMALSLSEEMDSTFIENPIFILEGLRRSADKFILFSEAGQIKVPQNANFIFSLLEDSVHEVALKNNKSFHPKIWIIKYVNDKDEKLYRLLVLSRNLTFDRSWDMAVALEGNRNNKKTLKNRPLSEFITFLLTYAKNDKKKKDMKEIISELDYVHFKSLDKNFTDFDFCPIGINGHGKAETDLFNTYHNMIIISPFLSKETVEELNDLSLANASKTLITRKTEIVKLDRGLLKDFDVYALKDLIVDGEETISGDNEKNDIYRRQDIHAKMYAKTKYNEHHIYLGSANCSNSAFYGNVEFMLKLKYQKWGFRITDLLVDLFGEDEKENPFEKIETIPEFEEAEVDIREQLQKAIKQLCRAKSKSTVIDKHGTYSINIEFGIIPEDINFTIAPLLSNNFEELRNLTVIENLRLIELGEFYKICAEKDGVELQRIIKIRTEGIPEDRDSEVFKSIISDKQTFLKYVAFLLSDDFLLSVIEEMEKKKNKSGKWELKALELPILYENMLKAASSSPEKLKDIENIIDIIKDKDIIPEEFNSLYKTFVSAVKKVKR